MRNREYVAPEVTGPILVLLFVVIIIMVRIESCRSKQGRELQLISVTQEGIYATRHWKDIKTGECFAQVGDSPLYREPCKAGPGE
jgi:hypothetical protein